MKKKILYIITQTEFGGAQRYVFDLVTNFSGEFDVLVAAGKDGNNELFSRLKALPLLPPPLNKGGIRRGVKTIQIKNLKRAISPWHDILALFEIRQLIKQEKPDIIHLNSSKAGILGSIATRLTNNAQRPIVIFTAHGWVFNEPLGRLKRNIYLFLEKWTAQYKNKIICVSEYDRQAALRRGFLTKKLITIHNGIDFDKIDFLNKENARQQLFGKISKIPAEGEARQGRQNLTSNIQIIGAIANLYPTKGIKYLIKAASILQKLSLQQKFSFPIFIVIGEGAERPKLEKLIKINNLENNFFFLNYIPDAYKYLKAFDIFVLPSIKEGFPYVILEAIAARAPIIATRVGGVPEIIDDEKNGILVQPGNSQELADKILFYLQKQKNDNSMAEEYKEKITDEFSLRQVIQKTKNIYLSHY